MLQISEKQQAEITAIGDAAIADFIHGLPSKIDNILTGAVLSVLGLTRDHYGSQSYKIDHCNGNRSVITGLMSDECKDLVAKLLQPIMLTAIEQVVKDEKFLTALVQEAASGLRDNLTRQLRESTGKYAAAQAKAMLTGLENVDLSGIFPQNTDVQDPESFDTDLGKLVLEKVVGKLVKGRTVKMVRRGKTTMMVDGE